MKNHSIGIVLIALLLLITGFSFSQNNKTEKAYFNYMQNENQKKCTGLIIKHNSELASSVDTVKCYSWMSANEEWFLNYMHINTYDDYGRLSETLTKFFDLQTMEFTLLLRHSYNHFPNDSVKSYLQELWNTELDGGSWDNTSLNEYEYDDQNRLVYNLTYFSPYGSHELNFGNRKYLSYNTDGLHDTILTQYFNTNENQWYYSYRYRYHYDAQMRLTDSYMDWANNQEGSYTLYQREIITYKNDGHKAEKVTFYYDDGEWTNVYLETIALNNFQLPDSILYQNWNPIDTMWDTTVMELAIFDYNEAGKLTEYITQSYYIFFVNNHRLVYYYDANNNVAESLSQQWDFGNDHWLNVSNCFYPLPPLTTAFNDDSENNNEFLVYPNPAHDFIEITLNNSPNYPGNISIFNFKGQLVLNTFFEKGNRINISTISPGLYLVRISADGQTQSAKILVK